MAEYSFSKITFTHHIEGAFRTIVELSVDEIADDSGELNLSLNAEEIDEAGEVCKVFDVDYFSEKEILEIYFFLKANLALKYGNLL